MEFWRELLAAVGGAVGIVVLILIFAKGLIQKWIENCMETASQKITLSYSDKLLRHSKAYEVLLEKEFGFYEQTSKYAADLIVDIQDVCGDLVNVFGKENNQNLVDAKETILRILQGVKTYKRDVLLAQSFIPSEVFNISSKLLECLQKNAHPLYELLKKANEQSMD